MSLHGEAMTLIAARMDEIGMTQTELAHRIGWTLKHVNRIMNGHAEPSFAALDFMAHIVGIELTIVARVLT